MNISAALPFVELSLPSRRSWHCRRPVWCSCRLVIGL